MANAVTGAELHSFLRSQGVEVREGRKGLIAVIGDTEIRIPHNWKKVAVDPTTLARVARALGQTPKSVREALDRPLNGGRPKRSMVLAKVPGATKAEVIEAVDGFGERLAGLGTFVRNGVHSPEVYGRALAALTAARRELEAAPRENDGDGYEAPSDKGYRPSQRDPLEHGPARVTGLTATAAKGRKTFTKYEHSKRTGGAA